MGFLPLLVVIGLTVFTVNQYLALRRNIQIVKTINLPYIILPWYTGTITWFILSSIVTPLLLYCLPSFMTRKWIEFVPPFWTWYLGFEPFERFNSDTLVTVAPGGITFHCASPEIISAIGSRRRDFLKPLDLYTVMNTFGPNIVSTDGPMWRHQRKIMAPSFNEDRNAMVWSETMFQMKGMLSSWQKQSRNLARGQYLNMQDGLRMMAFNVIARGAFGDRFPYPGCEGEDGDERKSGDVGGAGLKGAQKLRFGEATLMVVNYLKFIFVLPMWVMKYAPSKFLNRVWLGIHEMGTYLHEYISERGNEDSCHVGKVYQESILSSLIESSLESPMGDGIIQGLTPRQIIGNVFNTVTAGYETTSATLFYSVINLALHPAWQRQMQDDIDRIYCGGDLTKCAYTGGVDQLYKSSIDAVVRETLRLYPPNNVIPKHSTPHTAQVLDYKGKTINVPPNARLLFLTASTHRNPKYWPHSDRYNINSFHPERWFVSDAEAEKYGGQALPLHPAHPSSHRAGYKFFRPQKGAFIPWSIGHRDCIGRKFAHVEVMAALVYMFQEWSVELAVEDGGDWNGARDNAVRHMKDGMKHFTTMQLKRGLIPLKLVRRGRRGRRSVYDY